MRAQRDPLRHCLLARRSLLCPSRHTRSLISAGYTSQIQGLTYDKTLGAVKNIIPAVGGWGARTTLASPLPPKRPEPFSPLPPPPPSPLAPLPSSPLPASTNAVIAATCVHEATKVLTYCNLILDTHECAHTHTHTLTHTHTHTLSHTRPHTPSPRTGALLLQPHPQHVHALQRPVDGRRL